MGGLLICDYSHVDSHLLIRGLLKGPLKDAILMNNFTCPVPVLSGSKRIIIFSANSMMIDLINQLFQVAFFFHKINLVGIDDQ